MANTIQIEKEDYQLLKQLAKEEGGSKRAILHQALTAYQAMKNHSKEKPENLSPQRKIPSLWYRKGELDVFRKERKPLKPKHGSRLASEIVTGHRDE